MAALWQRMTLALLGSAGLVFGPGVVGGSAWAAQARPAGGCRVASLPPGVKRLLAEKFEGWRVQGQGDLSPTARERWRAEAPTECPGVALAGLGLEVRRSYALLLVPLAHPNAAYKLVVFMPRGTATSYGASVLDRWNGGGAGNFFIRAEQIRKFFDGPSRKRFQVEGSECILFIDAGEKEYEADVYFRSKGAYRHQPVDY